MRRLWLIVFLVLVASGCNSNVGGPAPRTTPTPSDRAGAPLISAPRNLASRADEPCKTLLTPKQLHEFGFLQSGVAGTDALGAPMCTWRAGDTGSRELSASVVLTRDLFVDTYRTKPLPVFRSIELVGLPAVESTAFENSPVCTTTVGVADSQTLDVSLARGTFGSESEADSCAISRRVAAAIVSTLPPL